MPNTVEFKTFVDDTNQFSLVKNTYGILGSWLRILLSVRSAVTYAGKGPMEKIYVECVYHTGGLRVRWALGLNHSHIYILMKHKDMRLMTESRPPSPQPALGTPSVCKTRYLGELK